MLFRKLTNPHNNKFYRHAGILMWKCYLQRQRRWHTLAAETVFASLVFIIALVVAYPVFLVPLQAEPEAPLTTTDLLASLKQGSIVGYTPDENPYAAIMNRAATMLGISLMSASTEYELNSDLYRIVKQSSAPVKDISVIWVIWLPKVNNTWRFSIRSTERARYETNNQYTSYPNPHLRAGCLAVQVAVSEAILEEEALKPDHEPRRAGDCQRGDPQGTLILNFKVETLKFVLYGPKIAHVAVRTLQDVTHLWHQSCVPVAWTRHSNSDHEVKLVSMPVSPLMKEDDVKRAVTIILLCFTIALIPPVLETQALVVNETTNRFKRALRIRGVSYASMYVGWLMYAYMTALPICFVAAITLLLIFRWVHLFVGLAMMLAYISAMFITALIMAMFHSKAWIACIWSSLYTLLQTYMSELLVHHEYDTLHGALTFLLHLLMPPLGLVHAINHFALLSTGKQQRVTSSLWYSFGSWGVLIVIYFTLLMILQKTIGHERAIGGQMPLKSIFIRKVEDVNALRKIENPTGKERDKLQEVDELVAKAVSFRNVSKSIMDVEILKNITFDIYRGEFTMLFSERVQERMIITAEDLLTGVTFPDKGSINVLGTELAEGVNLMTEPHMMGFCHRSTVLSEDLTVAEYFALFYEICLWKESSTYIQQYSSMRTSHLLRECHLEVVQNLQVRRLDTYYRAQLCWAIAMLLEPRVVVIPNFSDQHPRHNMVIKDKIMQYRKYLTVIKMCFSSLELEYADRVFVFDSKIIAFGGTPAYMFFKFGREYRVRMTIPTDLNEDLMRELIQKATEAGGYVRAHKGSLLILRLPTEPTAAIAKLVKDLRENAQRFGISSINISVPDSEEVNRRAMAESRALIFRAGENTDAVKNALKRMSEPVKWQRRQSNFINLIQVKHIGLKYLAFHSKFKLYFVITMIFAVLAGIFIGLSLSKLLARSERDDASKKLIHGELLTMEFTQVPTLLVLRVDNQTNSISVANAYVMSQPGATAADIAKISYTALAVSESLTEFLVTRAIDSPQIYVSLFAYGLDVKTNESGKILANALYSPLHKDQGSAARSLAKLYTSLLRHYTDKLDASIRVVDDPLTLDLTPWMSLANKPPLFVQFLLIMVISHIVLLPSMENGFIRHTQSHAMNFSPCRYWLALFLWDMVFYLLLVLVMSLLMLLIIFLVAPPGNFHYVELMVVPFVLTLYGMACVPQAYLFSLGPRIALNSMTFIIVNIVFGETTIIAQTFYGEVLNYALLLMSLSPQFNMAYAFVKIKQIFLYNSECLVFENEDLCTGKMLHKCCEKCGVLQECFKKRDYLTWKSGIFREIIALTSITALYICILFILEYNVCRRVWLWWSSSRQLSGPERERLQPGAQRECEHAHHKWTDIEFHRRTEEIGAHNPYGEYLLAYELTRRELGVYTTHGVCLGVGKGEALAISGLKRHGREKLLELLAGYQFPDSGQAVCMSKWNLRTDPHKYARQMSMSSEREALPPWMSVRHALGLVALLRGVPRRHIQAEVTNIIHALEMQEQANTLICRITAKPDRARLHFAAAVVGAPPLVIVDECTAHQTTSVCSAMYTILHVLKRRGHGIITSASSVECHLPVTNRLAFILDGSIFDIDSVDALVARYSRPGYTAVLHLKDEVDVPAMFARHFQRFVVNDTSEVLVNVQILDEDLDWAAIFEKMEDLKKTNAQVYSYIVTAIPIDYIYNSVINNEKGNRVATDFVAWKFMKKYRESQVHPSQEMLQALLPFERKYDITRLRELPWSVIFHT